MTDCPLPRRVAGFLDTLDLHDVESVIDVALCRAEPPLAPEHGRIAFFDDGVSTRRYLVSFRQQILSRICIDLNTWTVRKTINRYAEHGILDREAYWLNELENWGRTPRLIGAEGDTLQLTYVGEPVRWDNLPRDWQDQAAEILAILERTSCCHNDIKCDNLTVLDGRLHLIDFGWATHKYEPIPGEWPHGIGRQHRLGVHKFEDRVAIVAALHSAERGQIDHSIVMSS